MNTHYSLVPEQAEIAVIIPAFNNAPQLDQTLASVTGQTLAPTAVVIADDCSGDDTVQRALGWTDRLPLQVLKLERNSGPGIARHRAIMATSAPLLAMLDADDLFLPDHLETMAAAHAAAPGLISAQELSWYPGVSLSVPGAAKRGQRESSELLSLLRGNYINFGFFSRELYDLAGGFGDRYLCEDWELWIRMVRTGAPVTMAGHFTAIHRVHSRSLSFDAVRTARHGVSLLRAQLQAAQSPAEATAARSGLQALQAKLSYYRATELVVQGNVRQARHVALRGLPAGGPRATAGLLAMAIAPSAAVRLEQLTRRYRLPPGANGPDDSGQLPEPEQLAAAQASRPA